MDADAFPKLLWHERQHIDIRTTIFESTMSSRRSPDRLRTNLDPSQWFHARVTLPDYGKSPELDILIG